MYNIPKFIVGLAKTFNFFLVSIIRNTFYRLPEICWYLQVNRQLNSENK